MIGNKADKAVLVVVSVWFNRLQNTFLSFKKIEPVKNIPVAENRLSDKKWVPFWNVRISRKIF